ncbi:uncharacterized protein LOC134827033 [Culicoides brevitarsis]|uniref:uncharacterized protein LOC134827033 n=1 Tax=Culicoides brevitarsis TaxID=469753 RepID=UPI00307C550D
MKVFAIIAACIAVASAYGGNAGGYGAGGYVQPYGQQVHSYPAAAPRVDCGHNLLVSCQPTSATVPCVPSYGKGGYGAGAGYGGAMGGHGGAGYGGAQVAAGGYGAPAAGGYGGKVAGKAY